jgi:hypothetical protein
VWACAMAGAAERPEEGALRVPVPVSVLEGGRRRRTRG